ncbi:hypothetical protein [Hwangdonia lutea]|uniref:Uncharacterized protein n=1 Tax=Hwangdonia lutea TaxID=3075823 RepID=A0AA97EPM5_9FLAO|nr:hypothetical protein [Hwangdonia sp. SCSIO 19198]WOD44766.1 hypothetical protein RNZ46_05755 [Hwangdonia sp. SCSIO 19198]
MKSIHCKVFGHELIVARNVTNHVKEYTCKFCRKEFTTSSSGNLTELTKKYKEINRVLEYIHNKRISKTNRKNHNPNLLVFKH